MKKITIPMALFLVSCGVGVDLPGLPPGIEIPADIAPSACEDLWSDVVVTEVTACDTAGLAHCDAVELGSADTTDGEVAGCMADGRLCVYDCP